MLSNAVAACPGSAAGPGRPSRRAGSRRSRCHVIPREAPVDLQLVLAGDRERHRPVHRRHDRRDVGAFRLRADRRGRRRDRPGLRPRVALRLARRAFSVACIVADGAVRRELAAAVDVERHVVRVAELAELLREVPIELFEARRSALGPWSSSRCRGRAPVRLSRIVNSTSIESGWSRRARPVTSTSPRTRLRVRRVDGSTYLDAELELLEDPSAR